MADVHDKTTRSKNMSAIGGKNTKPEIVLRKELFRRGFRFRLHRKDLPGKPDIVLPKYRAVIQVHGCFWHGHEGCSMFKLPASRRDFWETKIGQNKDRDFRNREKLLASGWRVCEVWECAIKGRGRKVFEEIGDELSNWLNGDRPYVEICGKSRPPASAL